MLKTIVCILTIGVVMTVTGCSATREKIRASLPDESSDEAIVTHVEQRLRNDPVTAKLRLGVETVDGVVTLSGRIDQSAVRMHAIGLVRGTPGVRGVIDKTLQF